MYKNGQAYSCFARIADLATDETILQEKFSFASSFDFLSPSSCRSRILGYSFWTKGGLTFLFLLSTVSFTPPFLPSFLYFAILEVSFFHSVEEVPTEKIYNFKRSKNSEDIWQEPYISAQHQRLVANNKLNFLA